MEMADADPKGLIRESYRIEGITLGECRSIFIDWVLSLPVGANTTVAIHHLLGHYAEPDHPMSGVLREALITPETPKRRGGRAARVPNQ